MAGTRLMLTAVALFAAMQYPHEPMQSRVNHDRYKQDAPDDGLVFCRLAYQSNRWEPQGHGWKTDYPKAGRNLMTRFGEMTTAHVAMRAGEPVTWVIDATDSAIWRCPFLMASDVGTMVVTDAEAAALAGYLARGGFLWVDDFWAERSWQQWSSALRRMLPGAVVADLDPSHPIYRMLFRLSAVPRMTNIDHWKATGTTIEQGQEQPSMRGAYDKRGRMVVLMTWNTDIGDAWEREADDPAFFEAFAPDGYALGINVLLYAMSH